MTVTVVDLEQQLHNKHNIKLFCDIGLVSSSPVALIQTLDSVYQNHYDPDDRIVFYTSHVITEQLMQHFYETTNFLDISNWFILICGAKSSQALVQNCCEKFSQDHVSFQYVAVDLQNTQPLEEKFLLPTTICSIPWNHVEINQGGNISPCCLSTGLIYGNLKNTSILEAFHSKQARQLRHDLLSGKKPSSCQSCWKLEDNNLTSQRKNNIKRTKKTFLLTYLNNPTPASMDIKFNNTCNFKCRICSSESSSLIAQEQHKFLGTSLVVQDNWGESQNFIDQAVDLLPTLHNIDMYGGEPFLVKKFKKVLALAIEKNHAQHIRLHYNSNGSIWPEDFLPLWHYFEQVDIHFSIDAVGKQFEIERGGSWAQVSSNILRIKNLNLANLTISIMPTISVMNVLYLDQIYDWATANGFPIFINYACGPGLELQYLTQQARQIIMSKFADHPWDEIQNLLKIINELPYKNHKIFNQKMQWFDSVRDQNFSHSHGDIAQAMEYVYNIDNDTN